VFRKILKEILFVKVAHMNERKMKFKAVFVKEFVQNSIKQIQYQNRNGIAEN